MGKKFGETAVSPRIVGKGKRSLTINVPSYTYDFLELLADYVGKTTGELSRELLEIGIPAYLETRVNPLEEFRKFQTDKEIAQKVSRKLDRSLGQSQEGDSVGGDA